MCNNNSFNNIAESVGCTKLIEEHVEMIRNTNIYLAKIFRRPYKSTYKYVCLNK